MRSTLEGAITGSIPPDWGKQERTGRAWTGEDILVVGSVWFARYKTFGVEKDQTIEPSVLRTSLRTPKFDRRTLVEARREERSSEALSSD